VKLMKKSSGILLTAVLVLTSLSINSLSTGNNDDNEVAVQARVPEPWSVKNQVAVQARVPEPWSVKNQVAVQARVPEPWSVKNQVAVQARVPEPWSVKENFKA
jgi:hypothetical protein